MMASWTMQPVEQQKVSGSLVRLLLQVALA
jgi:hypothetical protein